MGTIKHYFIDEFVNSSIVIPSKYNSTTVHTIGSYAYYAIECDEIIITNGINKIKSYGICCEANSIYIPKSVEIINANGVYDANYYCVEAKEKPSEWDTYWHTSSSNSNVYFDFDFDYKIYEDKFIYEIKATEVHLIKYIGSSSTIKIPRMINGYEVTTIKEGFLNDKNYYAYVYIPKEVVMVEEKAFVNSYSYTWYFYCECSEEVTSWNENWYYSEYKSNNTSYKTIYWSYNIGY